MRMSIEDSIVLNEPPYVDATGLAAFLADHLKFVPTVLYGPKGIGKTLCLEWLAHTLNLANLQVSCTEGTKEKHLFGAMAPSDTPDQYWFVLGALAAATDMANEIAKTKECDGVMLRLGEVNALTPQMQKSLNAFTDWQQAVHLPQIGRALQLAEEARVWVVADMNPSAHGGVFDLNEDLKSRFQEVWLSYPHPTQERVILNTVVPGIDSDVITNMLDLATQTRQGSLSYALSTRDLVACLQNAYGRDDNKPMGLDKALKLLSYRYTEGEDRDAFHARTKAKTDIDLAGIALMTPPNLSSPATPGRARASI